MIKLSLLESLFIEDLLDSVEEYISQGEDMDILLPRVQEAIQIIRSLNLYEEELIDSLRETLEDIIYSGDR